MLMINYALWRYTALLLVLIGYAKCKKWLSDPNGGRGMYLCGALGVKSRISYFLCAERVFVVFWLAGWLEESLNALGINRPCRNVICFPPPRKKKRKLKVVRCVTRVQAFSCCVLADSFTCSRPSLRSVRSSRGCVRCEPFPWC